MLWQSMVAVNLLRIVLDSELVFIKFLFDWAFQYNVLYVNVHVSYSSKYHFDPLEQYTCYCFLKIILLIFFRVPMFLSDMYISAIFLFKCCIFLLLIIPFSICSFRGIFGTYKKCIASRSGRSFHTKFKARMCFFFSVTVFWGYIFLSFYLFCSSKSRGSFRSCYVQPQNRTVWCSRTYTSCKECIHSSWWGE